MPNELKPCPFSEDETNDCADCAYSGDFHFVKGECQRRDNNPELLKGCDEEWPEKKQSKHGTGGVEMTVIEFAEKRLHESCLSDDDEAIMYWRAYLDGARAQKKEYSNGMDKREG